MYSTPALPNAECRAALKAMPVSVRATRIASGIGQGMAVLLGVAGWFLLHSWVLPLAALFVFNAARQERAMVEARMAPPPPPPPGPYDPGA